MNIFFILACIIFIVWTVIIINYLFFSKGFLAWSNKIIMGILAVHIAVIIYRFIVLPGTRGYPWYNLVHGTFDQLLLMSCAAGIIVLVVRRYGPDMLTIYLPLYGAILYYLSTLSHEAPWVVPLEQDLFASLFIGLFVLAHACALIAGFLGLMWVGYGVRGHRYRQEQLSMLIHRLIGLFFPFFIIGIFFLWIWTYRTRGILWQWDTHILTNGILALIYLLYVNIRSGRGVFGKGTALVSLVGLVIVIWMYII